jgi:RimJ/RimL family protein N-acetyltransferase
MIEPLETARLRLRPIAEDDVDRLVELNADPAVMRFINGGLPTPRSDVEDAVHRAIGSRWLGFERDTDEFTGWFGLRPSDRGRELGYRTPRSVWGRGLATEASLALIDLAFAELDSEVVWAQTMTVNTASRGVMERCGLRYVRTFFAEWDDPIEGGEQGDVEYVLTKGEWSSRMEH